MTKINNVSKKVGKVQKDSNVSTKSYSYKYVDLNALISKLRPHWEEEDLNVTINPSGPHGVAIMCTCLHTGEFVYHRTEGKPNKVELQGQGSIITYLSRYSLMGMFNIEAYDDDDGQSANKEMLNGTDEKSKLWINKIKAGEVTLAEVEENYKVSPKFKARCK